MITSATSRSSGQQTTYEDNTNRIVLDGPADVRLGVSKADIVSAVQVGDDLVVTLTNGEQLVIENFFVADASGAVSRLIVESAVVPFEGVGESGLVAAGLGLLAAGVVASGSGDSGSGSSEATDDGEVALEKINAYDGTTATTAPTTDDYAAAGVEGVTDDNLAALNAAVAASADEDLTPEEIEALLAEVELQSALDVLNDYTGVGDVAPSAEDYAALGIEDLTPEQIAAVNALLPATDDLTSLEEVQALIDGVTQSAIDEIVAAATDGDDATDAAVDTFGEAGVTGVTEDNIDDINTYIAGLPEGSINSTEELQAIVDAVNEAIPEEQAGILAGVNAWDGTEDTATVNEALDALGIESIMADDFVAAVGLEDAIAQAIAEAVASNEGDLTVEELQALVAETEAEVLIDNMPMSTPEDTATALEAVGVTGVTETNQDEVQTAIAAAVDANPALANSPEDLQAIVDIVLAGLANEALDLINAYDGTDATIEPTLGDYIDAGVVVPEYLEGLSDEAAAAALDMLNEDVAYVEDELTVEDLQAMMDALAVEVATNVVSGYDADSTVAETPTLTDYEAMGVTGVTKDNILQLNAVVRDAASADTDEVAEIETMIAGLAAAEEAALAFIEAYNNDSDNAAAPTVKDYVAAGIKGVDQYTIDDINSLIEQLPEDTVMTQELLQSLSDITNFDVVDIDSGESVVLTVNDDGSFTLDLDRNGDGIADQSVNVTLNDDSLIAKIVSDSNNNGEPDNFNVYVYNDNGTLAYIDYSNNGIDYTGRQVYTYNEDESLNNTTTYAYVDNVLSNNISTITNYYDYDVYGNAQRVEYDIDGNGVVDSINYFTYDEFGNAIVSTIDRAADGIADGILENDERYTRTFNENQDETRIVTERFLEDGTPFLQRIGERGYDDQNRLVSNYLTGYDVPAADGSQAILSAVRVDQSYNDMSQVTDYLLMNTVFNPDGSVQFVNGVRDVKEDVDNAEGSARLEYRDYFFGNANYGYNEADNYTGDITIDIAQVDYLTISTFIESAMTMTSEQAALASLDPDDTRIATEIRLNSNNPFELRLSDAVIAELVNDDDDYALITGDETDTINNIGGTLEILADQTGVTAGYTAYDTDAGDILYIDDDINIINVAV